MVTLNIRALYSGPTMVHTLIVLCIWQQKCGTGVQCMKV